MYHALLINFSPIQTDEPEEQRRGHVKLGKEPGQGTLTEAVT
jgi:hypothetical protein